MTVDGMYPRFRSGNVNGRYLIERYFLSVHISWMNHIKPSHSGKQSVAESVVLSDRGPGNCPNYS
jgi:hypothetical protein